MSTSNGIRVNGFGSITLNTFELRAIGQEVKLTFGLELVGEGNEKLVEQIAQNFGRSRYVKIRTNVLVVVGNLAGYPGTSSLNVHADQFTAGLLGAIEGAATRRLATQDRRAAEPSTSTLKHRSKRQPGFINLGAHQKRR